MDDLANRIAKLYQNPELIRTYGQTGRGFTKTLAWENLMPKWLEVIRLASGVRANLQTEVAVLGDPA